MTTVKDLRVGDRFRLASYPHIGPFTLLSVSTAHAAARLKASRQVCDEWPIADHEPVEVISRAEDAERDAAWALLYGDTRPRPAIPPPPDQFASSAGAAGAVVGRALTASTPQPDGTHVVSIQLGGAELSCAARDSIRLRLEAALARWPLPGITVPPPAASVTVGYAVTIPMEPAPRCPSCDGTALRRTDHGAHYCAGCSWHGASLTAPPPAARFAVGQWVKLLKGAGDGPSVAQVLSVRASSADVWRYDLVSEVNDRKPLFHQLPERCLEACEAPR